MLAPPPPLSPPGSLRREVGSIAPRLMPASGHIWRTGRGGPTRPLVPAFWMRVIAFVAARRKALKRLLPDRGVAARRIRRKRAERRPWHTVTAAIDDSRGFGYRSLMGDASHRLHPAADGANRLLARHPRWRTPVEGRMKPAAVDETPATRDQPASSVERRPRTDLPSLDIRRIDRRGSRSGFAVRLTDDIEGSAEPGGAPAQVAVAGRRFPALMASRAPMPGSTFSGDAAGKFASQGAFGRVAARALSSSPLSARREVPLRPAKEPRASHEDGMALHRRFRTAALGGRDASRTVETVPPELVAGRVLHRRPVVGVGAPNRTWSLAARGDDHPRAVFAGAVDAGQTDVAQPLPSSVVPIARRTLGDGPLPSISAGPRTAQILRRVGAKAAAHGSTIYLDRTPGSDPRSRSVIAHELVHVAHGGDVPRFLDDEADDQEERAAQAEERDVARSAGPSQTAAPPTEGEADTEESGGEGSATAVDIDDLMDQLTDKLLVELERRGGRYRGVF